VIGLVESTLSTHFRLINGGSHLSKGHWPRAGSEVNRYAKDIERAQSSVSITLDERGHAGASDDASNAMSRGEVFQLNKLRYTRPD
jgi:hypothetical protein